MRRSLATALLLLAATAIAPACAYDPSPGYYGHAPVYGRGWGGGPAYYHRPPPRYSGWQAPRRGDYRHDHRHSGWRGRPPENRGWNHPPQHRPSPPPRRRSLSDALADDGRR